MSILGRLRRYFSRGARVLDPAAADRRAVAPDGRPTESQPEELAADQHPPTAPHLRPDPTDLEKEHRGY
ncbi:MAG: hypothetical protein IT304_07270 [Dehalococcoidia bacterium]|nr:hypothetical protein [Dehalococcoidia bacterium]